jgi:Co/Zn/Cd efflux system component
MDNKWIYLFATIGVLLNIVHALIWTRGEPSGEMLGYAVGGVLVSGAISYLIAGRRKHRNWNKFAVWFCCMSAIRLLIEIARYSGV